VQRLVAVVVVLLVAAGAGAAPPSAAAQDPAAAPHNGWHFVRGGEGAVPPAPVAKPMGDGRIAYDTAYVPFAAVGGITLHHPSIAVERIGFHQSNHEGAREQQVAETAAGPVLLDDRGRLSGRHSAADVVVAPGTEIRAPVTGTVTRAGTYVLYCDHTDDFVVIAPDAQPAWEVKVLHIDGVVVRAGDRVRAGVTTLAPRATVLPFRSQVDAHTAEPSWPHTHIEVIDPAIENVPNGGSGSDC
jgi:biotin carboxyl carrier protein